MARPDFRTEPNLTEPLNLEFFDIRNRTETEPFFSTKNRNLDPNRFSCGSEDVFFILFKLIDSHYFFTSNCVKLVISL